MPVFADGRIPVLIVADEQAMAAALAAGPEAAVLAEAPPPLLPAGAVAVARLEADGPVHAAACICCAGRPAATRALDALFLSRVKGQARWFSRVVAVVPEEAARRALATVLREDAVTASRYRAEG